jgi:hypothetical protein
LGEQKTEMGNEFQLFAFCFAATPLSAFSAAPIVEC